MYFLVFSLRHSSILLLASFFSFFSLPSHCSESNISGIMRVNAPMTSVALPYHFIQSASVGYAVILLWFGFSSTCSSFKINFHSPFFVYCQLLIRLYLSDWESKKKKSLFLRNKKKYELSTEHDTSGAVALLWLLNLKFVTIFKNKTLNLGTFRMCLSFSNASHYKFSVYLSNSSWCQPQDIVFLLLIS